MTSISFGGDESSYIQEAYVTGQSFNVGDTVIYQDRECTVSKAVDSGGDLKVRYPPAKLTADMTEADLSGLGLGAGDVMIAAAFLPRMG